MRLIIISLVLVNLTACSTSFKEQCLNNFGIYTAVNDQEACFINGKMVYPSVVPNKEPPFQHGQDH